MIDHGGEDLRRRVQESFDRQGLMRNFGARVDNVVVAEVTISAPVGPDNSQQHGFAHAGLTFALGDSAAGYAALTTMPRGSEVVTSEMKINLLAPGTGARLIATGKVVRAGKRLVVTTAEVVRDDGTLVALLQGTMVPVAPAS